MLRGEGTYRNQRHSCGHTCQQASVNGEEDEAVDDSLGTTEACARTLKEENKRGCDAYVGCDTQNVD